MAIIPSHKREYGLKLGQLKNNARWVDKNG